MPTYFRNEFAPLCGMSQNSLTTYVRRGKITLDEDGKVDTSKRINQEFLDKRLAKIKKDAGKEAPVSESKKAYDKAISELQDVEVQETKKQKRKPKKQVGETIEETASYNLDRRAKELGVEESEEKVKKLKLQNAKLTGEAIPMDIVLLTMQHHFRNVSTSFYNASDNFITNITTRLGAEQSEVAHIRKDLIEIVNKAIKDAIKQSKKDINKISAEYSEMRGKGEGR